ncbi:MAG: hypothetical protein WKF94_06710 [Solirubrobacteraceae bacterium]
MTYEVFHLDAAVREAPMIVDPYRRNRSTGSFILIDESTNNTVAAGMVLDREI